MSVMTFLLTLTPCVVFVAMGIPVVVGVVPPNRIYGFRIKQTLQDPEVWYPANRVAGLWMLLGLALYALLYQVRSVPVPEGLAPRGSNWDVVMSVVLVFAGICTVVGLLFLGIGVVRLGGPSR